jgi:hypothetical protein
MFCVSTAHTDPSSRTPLHTHPPQPHQTYHHLQPRPRRRKLPEGARRVRPSWWRESAHVRVCNPAKKGGGRMEVESDGCISHFYSRRAADRVWEEKRCSNGLVRSDLRRNVRRRVRAGATVCLLCRGGPRGCAYCPHVAPLAREHRMAGDYDERTQLNQVCTPLVGRCGAPEVEFNHHTPAAHFVPTRAPFLKVWCTPSTLL